jgi:hypothetical protein
MSNQINTLTTISIYLNPKDTIENKTPTDATERSSACAASTQHRVCLMGGGTVAPH